MTQTNEHVPHVVRPFYRRPLEWGLIGLAAVLLIWIADYLDVLPDRLEVFGAEAEFRQEDKQVLIQNDKALAELRGELDKLKVDVAALVDRNGGGSGPTAAEILEPPKDENVVSESFLQPEIVESGTGVMWIGEYDPALGWVDGTVAGRSLFLPAPDDLIGETVNLITKVNIRDGYPVRDDRYYRAIPVLGIADVGTAAVIEDIAPGYERATGNQYWARVTIDYTPKEPDAVVATRADNGGG